MNGVIRSFGRCLLPALLVLASPEAPGNSVQIPAGYVGYIYYQPIFATWLKSGFSGIVKGPGNWSWSPFHYEAIVIDVRPRTYDEPFQILAKDQLNISFEVHAILRPNPDQIKAVVEDFGGVEWYQRVVQAPLRTFVQKTVETYTSQEANDNRSRIEDSVTDYLRSYIRDKPFFLDSLTVGNIQFPPAVTRAVELKVSNQQLLEKKKTDMQIAKQDAEIRAIEAEGIRRSQEIINKTLSPIYVQHELVKSLGELAKNSGNVIYFVPTDENGLPRVNQVKEISTHP
jgi:SPFH domain / Band 7 family